MFGTRQHGESKRSSLNSIFLMPVVLHFTAVIAAYAGMKAVV